MTEKRICTAISVFLIWATTVFGAYRMGQYWGFDLVEDAYNREAKTRALALHLLDTSTRALSVVREHQSATHWEVLRVIPEWHYEAIMARQVLDP